MHKLTHGLRLALWGASILTVVASAMSLPSVIVLVLACLGLVPFAGLIGRATDSISEHVGPTLGGLINATFGNAPELIIGVLAVRAGLLDVVKATITGSIISNILLVLGMSMLVGGVNRGEQVFNKNTASSSATLLTFMAICLIVPSMALGSGDHPARAVNLSIVLSCILLVLYALGLFFSLGTHKHLFVPESSSEDGGADAEWSVKKALAVLLFATLAVVFLSEQIVNTVESAASSMHISPVFIGVILLAIVGNAAEHYSAVAMARKNKMDLSINIALGSALQIAMVVAPVMVLAGVAFGQPMTLLFSLLEIGSVVASITVLKLVVEDGKSNWLEGAALLSLYGVLATCFLFAPS